jgi:hypothetical protein
MKTHTNLKRGDPASAPRNQFQKAVEDGQSINVPVDAMGAEIDSYVFPGNRVAKGNANYAGPVKDVMGSDEFFGPDKGEDKDEDEDEDEGEEED